MKIAVVVSYHNRQKQFDHTVLAMSKTKARNVELIVVDDASDPPLAYIHEAWRKRESHVLRTKPEEKFWTSVPAVPFNRGIQLALDRKADVVVLQSPECKPIGDVLGRVEAAARKGLYLTFACLALTKEDTFDEWVEGKERVLGAAYTRPTSSRGGVGWFNHSVHRPCHLEFCAALCRDDILALNGYDERFADGVAFGDADLLRRVKNLGLELRIVDDPFVVHQWHYDGPDPYQDTVRFERNKRLFQRLEAEDKGHRAVHIFTEDLR